jgi:hypothetical protein
VGTPPRELERQIERTREDLRHTLDLLEYKLSPRRVARQNRHKLRVAAAAMAALMAIVIGRKVIRARRDDD